MPDPLVDSGHDVLLCTTGIRYDELTQWLDEFASQYPALVRKTSIGRSYEDRDIWLLTVTNHDLGDADEKPAIWIDGNIHASEVTASMAIVHLLDTLTAGYGTDERITRALDTRTFYLVPQVSPDGAELSLAELPSFVPAASTRGPSSNSRPDSSRRTSTRTAASSRCASKTRTASGSRTRTIRGS
ncbi:MAG: M14 family zinc carboxypeptidase [Ilumatobacteraceae bacterium]